MSIQPVCEALQEPIEFHPETVFEKALQAMRVLAAKVTAIALKINYPQFVSTPVRLLLNAHKHMSLINIKLRCGQVLSRVVLSRRISLVNLKTSLGLMLHKKNLIIHVIGLYLILNMTMRLWKHIDIRQLCAFRAHRVNEVKEAFALIYADQSLSIEDKEKAILSLRQTYATFLDDEKFAVLLMQVDGLMLEDLSERLRHKEEIVLAAVEQNGWVADMAPKKLHLDKRGRDLMSKFLLEGIYVIIPERACTWVLERIPERVHDYIIAVTSDELCVSERVNRAAVKWHHRDLKLDDELFDDESDLTCSKVLTSCTRCLRDHLQGDEEEQEIRQFLQAWGNP